MSVIKSHEDRTPSLSVVFQSTTRDGLYDFFKSLIKAIPKDFIKRSNQCLITVNGDPDTGKSMLWDIARELHHTQKSLLKSHSRTEAHRITAPSEAIRTEIRVVESYEGNALNLLFANAHSLSTHKDPEAQKLLRTLVDLENTFANDNPPPSAPLGNIIILNNVMTFNGFAGKNAPVQIEITDPTMSWSGASSHWNRKTVVEINHPALLCAPMVQEFAQRYS
ncbi:MAG TPA: hypothetical protein PLK85_02430 [Alphaproteobacteria bacterium]|nr:hypothetical protein [Alphaproteobacteria bacterium]